MDIDPLYIQPKGHLDNTVSIEVLDEHGKPLDVYIAECASSFFLQTVVYYCCFCSANFENEQIKNFHEKEHIDYFFEHRKKYKLFWDCSNFGGTYFLVDRFPKEVFECEHCYAEISSKKNLKRHNRTCKKGPKNA